MTLKWKRAKNTEKNKRTEIERFDWFIERIQTRVAIGWLSERLGEKNFMPENFLEINRYFALTSYCNTIGQSNNALSILGFSLAGKRKSLCYDLFIHWLIKQNNEHLPKPFFKIIRSIQPFTNLSTLEAIHENALLQSFTFERKCLQRSAVNCRI